MTITEFLLARIAEDEADACAADSGRWLAEDKGVTFDWRADDFHDGEAQARLTADTKANMWHISNWAPHRVLAECEAKRRIVDSHRWYQENAGRGTVSMDALLLAEAHAQRVAEIYADHPDYQEEWRP